MATKSVYLTIAVFIFGLGIAAVTKGLFLEGIIGIIIAALFAFAYDIEKTPAKDMPKDLDTIKKYLAEYSTVVSAHSKTIEDAVGKLMSTINIDKEKPIPMSADKEKPKQ
ncbi:hypothetical protein [Mycobacterium sp.]|uniref:hypothetical protein n=1 Tax=Mycobacterium sp. TaxID=1785 RepID=UPI0031E472F2